MNDIKTLIIEDEPSAVNRLKKELDQLTIAKFDILEDIESISRSIDFIEKNRDIELIFMDIHLTDGLSLEIFNQVEVSCPVIFTTAYDEYALQAFKLNSIDYLLKPIDPDELKTAVQKFLDINKGFDSNEYLNQLKSIASQIRNPEYRSSFLVSYRQKMMMIDVSDVAYFYVKERGVFLRKKDSKEYVIDFFLDDLEQQLDPKSFYRANRQFLVSRSSIHEIEPYFNGRLILDVMPKFDSPVTISKEKATHFKRWADY